MASGTDKPLVRHFPSPRWSRVAAPLVVATVLGALVAQPVRADTEAQLKAAEKKLNGLIDQISSEQKTVDGLQQQVDDLTVQIDQKQSEIARTQASIANLQQEIRLAIRQVRRTQGILDQRAWLAYESGPGSDIEFILGSTSLSDLTDRVEIVNSAAQSDETVIAQLQAQKSALQAKQNDLFSLEQRQQDQRDKLLKQEKQVEDDLTAEQQVLTKLDADKASADKLVKKLKKKRAAEIAALRAAERAATHGGAAIKGVFGVCPVDQPHSYSDDLGAPRYSGGFHLHAGNDILAPRGTPIRAPFDGSATISSNGLGGLSVTVTGAVGYVYNAHLNSLGTLGSVSTGTIIGYVGDSGDALGGPTHDHFEFHPNNPNQWGQLHVSPYGVSMVGTAIDPYPFLNAVC
jgi:peptidoglycan hydrolase CwlO-like protein